MSVYHSAVQLYWAHAGTCISVSYWRSQSFSVYNTVKKYSKIITLILEINPKDDACTTFEIKLHLAAIIPPKKDGYTVKVIHSVY